MTAATSPSEAERASRLLMPFSPLTRMISIALVWSPSASSRAFFTSSMPAPVRSRSALMSAAVKFAMRLRSFLWVSGPSGLVTTGGGLVLGHGVRALVHRVLVLVRGGCGLFGALLGLGRLLSGSIGSGLGGRRCRCGIGLDRGVRSVGSGGFGLFLTGGGLGTGGLLLGRGGQQFALPLGQGLGLAATGGVLTA